MHVRWTFVAAMLVAGCGGASVKVDPKLDAASPDERAALEFVLDLAKHDEAAAMKLAAPKRREQWSTEQLAKLWSGFELGPGALVAIESAKSSSTKGGATNVIFTARFVEARRLVRLNVEQGAIAGVSVTPVPEDVEPEARSFVELLAKGDTTRALELSPKNLRTGAVAHDLAEQWRAIEAKNGKFSGVERASMRVEGAAHWVLVASSFEKGRAVIRVALDAKDHVTAIEALPGDADAAWSPPSYARPGALRHRDVKLATTPELPGVLTTPKTGGPFPAVVLVHGSGPNDLDESKGGTKIFRDLALGLASRGVAVLRYQKRTRVDPTGVASAKEEVLDGARAAIELVAHASEIDPKRIVVVGHSQGGYFAPWIARESPAVAGLVLLAGPSRPLEDVLVDQARFLGELHGGPAVAQKQLEKAELFRARVRDPGLKPDDVLESSFGARFRGSEFLFVRGYDPGAVAAKLDAPVLVLQGQRDYQVTRPDLEGWQRALAGSKKATFKLYLDLNHYFVSGKGDPSPEEYELPGHFSEQALEDIARWVASISK